MRRKFPQTSPYFDREDPIVSSNVRSPGENYGSSTQHTCISHKADSTGSIQYVANCLLISLTNHNTEKFAKKILGESDIEAVLQRLDRLTQEESRMTVTHTLEVVHGLFDNLKVIMDGGVPYPGYHQTIQLTRPLE